MAAHDHGGSADGRACPECGEIVYSPPRSCWCGLQLATQGAIDEHTARAHPVVMAYLSFP